MDVIEEERLMQHAKEVGAYLLEKLLVLQNKHVLIGDVRYVLPSVFLMHTLRRFREIFCIGVMLSSKWLREHL